MKLVFPLNDDINVAAVKKFISENYPECDFREFSDKAIRLKKNAYHCVSFVVEHNKKKGTSTVRLVRANTQMTTILGFGPIITPITIGPFFEDVSSNFREYMTEHFGQYEVKYGWAERVLKNINGARYRFYWVVGNLLCLLAAYILFYYSDMSIRSYLYRGDYELTHEYDWVANPINNHEARLILVHLSTNRVVYTKTFERDPKGTEGYPMYPSWAEAQKGRHIPYTDERDGAIIVKDYANGDAFIGPQGQPTKRGAFEFCHRSNLIQEGYGKYAQYYDYQLRPVDNLYTKLNSWKQAGTTDWLYLVWLLIVAVPFNIFYRRYYKRKVQPSDSEKPTVKPGK